MNKSKNKGHRENQKGISPCKSASTPSSLWTSYTKLNKEIFFLNYIVIYGYDIVMLVVNVSTLTTN